MSSNRSSHRIFLALDTPDIGRALELAAAVRPFVSGLKIGLEFLTANGPAGVKRIVSLGLPVFADTKFHDIPNTVAGASREMALLGVSMFNVHASGGSAMMRASREAARQVNPDVRVLAVTVLTSLDAKELDAVGQRPPVEAQVLKLAALSREAGLDGIVCGAGEVRPLRAALGSKCLIVVPGIRPAGVDAADQRRTMTPAAAAGAGADILVVGRPIAAAADPVAAARAIAAELSEIPA